MRRIVLTLLLGGLLAVSMAAPAAARKGNLPSEVQGTYTYNQDGRSITVGYVCPGWTNVWGTDPYANYYAYVSKGQWAISISRHAPWKLDVSLQELLGLRLTEKAYQVLENDAATIPCP